MASAFVVLIACDRRTDLRIFSESVRPARGVAPPDSSAVFDGKVVRLRGARGETLGIAVGTADGQNRLARLELPSDVAKVSGFSVRSLSVREPSSSMYGESTGPGTYPDVLVPSTGNAPPGDLVFFDVAIPPSAIPGRYRGELTVEGRYVEVMLDVSRARIDLSKSPLVWVFYSPSEIARTSGLANDDGPDLIAKEAEYDVLFRAHGAYLASDVSPSRFTPRRHFVHDVEYWPVAIDARSDDSITNDVRQWLDLFRGTGVTPFAIPVDEPRSAEEKERARHIAAVVGRAGGGRPALLRAVTDKASIAYGDAIDVFVSPANFPAVRTEREARGERFWTYNGRPPAAGSMILDTEGAALRTWGWIAERYDIELWYAWEGLYFSDRYNRGGPTDVMYDPITFDERTKGGSDWGNGDGVLAYPGPLPSLRLKVLRRGLQDRLLLRELERCGAGQLARDIVVRTVPRALGEASDVSAWPTNEMDWERARNDVLDSIESRCHGDA
jgi:hypothetical protein